MSIAIALLEACDEVFAMTFDAGDVLVRQPVPAELNMVLDLLPIGLNMTLDEKNQYSHYAVAMAHVFGGECNTAIEAARQALSLSPSFALGHLILGAAYLHSGRSQEAIEPLEHGLRLSPFDPQNFTWLFLLSVSYIFSGNLEVGLSTARRALSLRPHWVPALKVIVLCCKLLDDLPHARSAASQIPSASALEGDLARLIPVSNPAWINQIEQAVREVLENEQYE